MTDKESYRDEFGKAGKGLYKAKRGDIDNGAVKTERKLAEWCRLCRCLTFTQTEILKKSYLGTGMYLGDSGG